MKISSSLPRHFLYLILLVLTTALAGCDKNTTEEPSEPDKPGDITETDIDSADVLPVHNLGEDFSSYIESIDYSPDSTTIYVSLKQSTPAGRIPKEASIIVIPECEMFPDGFGATVRSVRLSPTIMLTCSWPDLSQFAEEFNLSTADGTLEISEIEVFDQDGNRIEFEEYDPDDQGSSSRSRAGICNLITRQHLDLSVSNGTAWNHLRFLGQVYYGFRYIGATIQKERGRRTIMTFDIEPTLGLNVSSIVECKAEVNKDIRIGQLRTNLKALVAGVPVVFPVTFYLYFEAAAAGSITFESTLTHEFSSAFTISNSSGQWRSSRRNGDGNNGDESPWGIQKIDLDGSISTGLRAGVIVGLYSATTGVGINLIPKYTLSASASLSSDDLYRINPMVSNNIGIESEIYVAAKLFGCDLGKYTYSFPKIDLYDNSIHLFPGISGFKVGEGATETEKVVEYDREKHFFLENIQAEEGLVLLDENSEVVGRYKPTSTEENESKIHKKQYLSRLKPKKTYYAAPFYSIFGKTFIGNEYLFKTDDIIESRTYRLSILNSADERLLPDKKEFIIKADVGAEGDIEITNIEGMERQGNDWYYSWIDNVERTDGESTITFKEERASLRISAYVSDNPYSLCINEAHNHSDDSNTMINTSIGYQYHYYYVFRQAYENQAYSKYYYSWTSKRAEFWLSSDGKTQTPCDGQDNKGSMNTVYTTIHNITAKLERIGQ